MADDERPTLDRIGREVRHLRRDVEHLAIEVAQQDEKFARRDVLDSRLAGEAAVTSERLAGIVARLDGIDKAMDRVEAHDNARRNMVFAAIAAGVVGLVSAAVTAGVLG